MKYYATLAITKDIKIYTVFHRGLDSAMGWLNAHKVEILDASITEISKERFQKGVLSTLCMN